MGTKGHPSSAPGLATNEMGHPDHPAWATKIHLGKKKNCNLYTGREDKVPVGYAGEEGERQKSSEGVEGLHAGKPTSDRLPFGIFF